MKRLRLALLALLLLALNAAAEEPATPPAPPAQPVYTAEELREIELGDAIAARLVGAMPLLDNTRIQAYVNAVGAWVAMQGERPDLPWKFGVLNNKSIASFSTPGGYVFITSGLLALTISETELAGVLAHEIAHVLKKHHLAAIDKTAVSDQSGEITSKAAAAIELYARGLSADEEFEADLMALTLISRAGYDPNGLPALVHKLESFDRNDGMVALLNKTMPSPSERLQRLEQILLAHPADFKDGLQVNGDRFSRFVANPTAQ
ncbi:MAG: M48 family metalloprotease [Pseudomonadota bacterium]